jgi:subtilisin-like proprotein convertase family protein
MKSRKGPSSILDLGFWILDSRRRVALVSFLVIITLVVASLMSPVQRSVAQQAELPQDETTFTQTYSSTSGSGNRMPPGITYTFHNPAAINIPVGSMTGNLYPSSINVTNAPPQIAKVTVVLRQMTHLFASDIDILLVGPQGQTAIIMSDIGGGSDMSNVTITLDDEAPTIIPANGPILDGATYRPTDASNSAPDPFPAPAPQGISLNSALNIFNGTNPNGEWRLFALDDVPGFDPFQINGGWSLNITVAISGQNPAAISILDNAAASPYPSEIPLTDHPDPVSMVRVTLTNFSHSSPDDVDIMLASPSGRVVTLMSDVGGTNAVSSLNLTFDDAATASLPDSGPLTSGTYRPTDFEPGDLFPPPAPSGGPGKMLASLNGSVANGAWRLFVVDDDGNNAGSIFGGWNVLVATAPETISISGNGVANPYPSEISVTGHPGNITRAVVNIQNFSHIAPDDTDMLLVGPGGRKIVLMSDAGGTSEVGGLNLTFDDLAATQVPDNTLSTGTYRPADYEPGETFPAPAPQTGPTGTTLTGTFYGGTPNGIWRLYAVNENSGTYGSIAAAWSLTLQSSTSACLMTINPSVQAFPIGGGSGSFSIGQPNGCAWNATTTDSFLEITSPASGGGNGAISFNVAANNGPARTGTIDVSNGVTTRSFQVQQAGGCSFAVNQSTVNFGHRGGNGNVAVTVVGPCAWQAATSASWIQVTSPQQTGSGAVAFTVQANQTRQPRSAIINVGGGQVISVNQAPLKATPFDFNGDGRTDVSVFRPSTGTWWIAPSAAIQFGIATDRIVPADYDGDLKADIAVYRDGVWYVLRSTDGVVRILEWGTAGDVPVPHDYDGDGNAQVAVYRQGTWWILNQNGTYTTVAFGTDTDRPTAADYDGDGKVDLSVFRLPTATWWILRSSDGGVEQHPFGLSTDIPEPGDYDGDGRDGPGVYRPSTGYWYRSLNPATNYDGVQWGTSGDRPSPGDYDGDGRADPAVFRSSNGTWWVLGTTSGPQGYAFGMSGDVAVPGRP